MHVRRYFQSVLAGNLDDCRDVLLRHLRGTGLDSVRKDGARRDHLEEVCAIFHRAPGRLRKFFRRFGDAGANRRRYLAFIVVGKKNVPATAANGEVGSSRLNPGADRKPGPDLIPNVVDIFGVIVARVANRREAGHQVDLRVLGRGLHKFLVGQPVIDRVIMGVVRHIGEMHMRVDQPGQAGVVGEVEENDVIGRRRVLADAFEAAIADNDELVLERPVADTVNELSATD